MTRMIQFGLAAIFTIGLALLTSSPTQAQYSIDLTPTVDASYPDYGASGEATLSEPFY